MQAKSKPDVDPNSAKSDGQAVSGLYDGTRRGETTLLKIVALASQFSVRSDKEGVLQIEGMKNQSGELQRWREIAPLVYREIDGLERLGFRRDASGAVAEMLPFPAIYEGQRVPWYASKIFIGLTGWWKFAARAPHRIAVARRGHNPQTISAPALQYEK